VEREYLFHRVRVSCFLATWLSQSAESSDAEICDRRSGRRNSAACTFKSVIHVDDAEKELRFRVKLEPPQRRKIRGLMLRNRRHVNVADRAINLPRQRIAPIDMDIVVLSLALVDVPDRTQVKAQLDVWWNAIADIGDKRGLVVQRPIDPS
jgi:hypothetical protein